MRCALFVSLGIALFGNLQGCSTRYGHAMQQSTVQVTTLPPGKTYYVVPLAKLEGLVHLGSSEVPMAQAAGLRQVLATQVSDRANGSGFLHQTGNFALIVDCTSLFKIRLVQVLAEGANTFNLSCEP